MALVWSSCGGIGEPGDPNHCKSTYCVGGEATVSYASHGVPTSLDLLVVLDDSVASGPYAPRLESALRTMMRNKMPYSAWDRYEPDLNVALVPAAMGFENTGASPPSRLWPETAYCPMPSGPFLHTARLCDAPSNILGDWADTVACAALHLPASGQPPSPLETIRSLLEPGGLAETSGFRRKNVPLLLVIVSTQDDPTAADAATLAAYRDFLGTVADPPDEALLAGVVAPTTAKGLSAFAESFGENGALSEITDESWSAIPFVTEEHLIRDFFPICIDWPVDDADPNAEGLQPDCVASEIHRSLSAARTEQILPRCLDDGSTPKPCWSVSWNPNRCAPDKFEFVVEEAPPVCLPSYVVRYSFTCAIRYQ